VSLTALEEHDAWNPGGSDDVVATWLRTDDPTAHTRLYDRGTLRPEQLNAAGIDFQILRLFGPGVQDETGLVGTSAMVLDEVLSARAVDALAAR
jgi:2,3-dihydroxybenzoate decarboxylase